MKAHSIYIAGRPPSLKNSRVLRVGDDNKPQIVPSPQVKTYLLKARSSIVDQFPIEPYKTPVFICAAVCLYYKGATLPSDLDNMYTTVQEALIGTVVEDDSLVHGFLVSAKQVVDKALEHVYLVVFDLSSGVSISDAVRHFEESGRLRHAMV